LEQKGQGEFVHPGHTGFTIYTLWLIEYELVKV